MEKVLSQAEIDALFCAAQGESAANAKPLYQLVEAWDLRNTGMVAGEQLHGLNRLLEGFARSLTAAVGAHLGDRFEVALVAIEQLAYRDFLARSAELTYYSTFRLPPGEERGILQLELALAFPVVDVLLGGTGKLPSGTRDITEIEEALLADIGQLICHELWNALRPFNVETEFERRQPPSQMARIMPPEEKVLALTFDATMAESKGSMNIVLPTGAASGLLRRMRAELVFRRTSGLPLHQQSIGARLLQSAVNLELASPAIAVPISELLALRPGAVLSLRRRIDEPAVLRVAHRNCWSARAVSSRQYRAAQLLDEIASRQEEDTA